MQATIKRPVVWYTGNIWSKPGEVVTFSGSGLGDNVKQIELCRVSDKNNVDQASYMPIIRYDGVSRESQYFSKVSENSYSFEDAATLEILQKTDTSVKFRIPEDESEGIWAVRLSGDGFSPIIRLINAPNINFVLGDEGGKATPGGWIFVSGSGVYPETAADKVRLLLKNREYTYLLEAAEGDFEYGAKFYLPEEAALGEYEVSLYNGYGDDGCWSVPLEIAVGTSPKAAWPKEVFNVKDFGAKGIGQHHNDTPNIISALRAAEENGGGTVLFPRGTYMLVHPITVPENVTLKGEGIIKTKFILVPYNWDTFELPDAMIRMTKNVEITGIDISAQRLGPLFVASEGNSENIYINNIRVLLIPRGGAPSGAHFLGNNWESHTLQGLVADEINIFAHVNGSTVFKMFGVENLQIHNIDSTSDGTTYIVSGCKNVHISDYKCTAEGMTILSNVENALVENCVFRGNTSSLAGSNIHFARNTLKDRLLNNREIMTTDGGGQYGSGDGRLSMQKVDETTFRLESKFPQNKLKDMQLVIQQGKGAGQTRRIIENSEDLVKIDEPFVVDPEDGISRVSVLETRKNTVTVSNKLYNGGAYQYYGVQMNSVIAHNDVEKALGFWFKGGGTYNCIQPNWYISVAENTLWDANFFKYSCEWYRLNFDPKIEVTAGSALENNQLCLNICRNELKDGFYIKVGSGKEKNTPIKDMIIQNNSISDSRFGINLNGMNNGCRGILITDNNFENVETPYIVQRSCLEEDCRKDGIRLCDKEAETAEILG